MRTRARLRTETSVSVPIPVTSGATHPGSGTTMDARCHLRMDMWSVGNGNRKENCLSGGQQAVMKFRTCDGFNTRFLPTIRTSNDLDGRWKNPSGLRLTPLCGSHCLKNKEGKDLLPQGD